MPHASLLTPHSSHLPAVILIFHRDFGSIFLISQLKCFSDNAFLTPVFSEVQAGLDLGRHASLGKLTFFKIFQCILYN